MICVLVAFMIVCVAATIVNIGLVQRLDILEKKIDSLDSKVNVVADDADRASTTVRTCRILLMRLVHGDPKEQSD
jgi:uncharacterized protein YoxC